MATPTTGEKLAAFIRTAKERGVDDDALVALLRHNGWSDRRIYASLSSYYEQTLGSPVPTRASGVENARDAFLYLLAFVTLGVWVVALIWLGNILIDHAFANTLDNAYFVQLETSDIAGQVASIIVAFPIFLIVSRLIVRSVRSNPEALESGVRTWLTYIALVITAIALIGDAVMFLQQFLAGGLTVRFACRALLLFVVAAGVFWYYLGTMRLPDAAPARDRIFGWASVVAVVVGIALGFGSIGSPMHQRQVSMDSRRVDDLKAIAGKLQIPNDAAHKGATLPAQLTPQLFNRKDPGTGKTYEYVPGKGASYQLCAVFDTDDTGTAKDSFWKHPSGHTCFVLQATANIPEQYTSY